MSESKKEKKADKKKAGKKDTDDQSRRNLWIALAVLAVLAAVLWYLYDQGYLRQWFSQTQGTQGRRSGGRQQSFSPSAPPFQGDF